MDDARFEHKMATAGIAVDKLCYQSEDRKQKHLYINEEYLYWTKSPEEHEMDFERCIALTEIKSFSEGSVAFAEYVTIISSNEKRPKMILYIKDKDTFEFLIRLLGKIQYKHHHDQIHHDHK